MTATLKETGAQEARLKIKALVNQLDFVHRGLCWGDPYKQRNFSQGDSSMKNKQKNASYDNQIKASCHFCGATVGSNYKFDNVLFYLTNMCY
ncbi:MAG: hypothetical protein Q3M24_12185 [Candidatus Electrothrix aestuarii]|uniref:Uncharacterized protein n=1 Tax=Candidatus Electrothrix aestuarii TaxID=3062594 RepID=A0AAU8LQ97_9BACT|nr:hypothetical protein [Candidatus Electrothrix aestuarii]